MDTYANHNSNVLALGAYDTVNTTSTRVGQWTRRSNSSQDTTNTSHSIDGMSVARLEAGTHNVELQIQRVVGIGEITVLKTTSAPLYFSAERISF